MVLISSPVITGFSPSSLTPVILKMGFAFASSENGDDEESNTDDATTTRDDGDENGDGDEQQEGDNSNQQQQDVQEEGDTEGEEQDGGGERQEQQFATVVGEICDDFEDNDGDGLIDLADVEDCAPPATQGTETAPTTPPPPSVVNTTATNSTNNTLTAAGTTTQQQESPYIVEVCDNRIDDDGDGLADLDDFEGCAPLSTSSNTRYMTPSGNIVDVTGCTSFEELGVEPAPPSPGDPPNLVYFDCDNITWGLIPLDSTTTTTDSGTGTAGGGQQGLAQGQGQQQQPNSASACPPQPTNYHTAQDLIIHVQLLPSSPPSQTTTNPCPPGESSSSSTAATPPSPQSPPTTTTSQGQQQPQQQAPGTSPDSTGSTTTFPGGPTITTTEKKDTVPGVETRFPDDTHIDRTPEGIMSVRIPYRTSIPSEGASIPMLEHIVVDYSPKDGISIDLPPEYPTIPGDYIRGVFIGPDNTVRTWDKSDNTYTYYNPDGSSITQKADGTGRVIKFSNPNDAAITSHQGSVTIQYPDDGPTITTTKKEGTAPGVDIRFSGGIVIHKSSKGTVEVGIPEPGSINKLSTLFSPDGTIAKIGMGDLNVLKPDNTASTKKPDGTLTTYNPDGTVTTSPK